MNASISPAVWADSVARATAWHDPLRALADQLVADVASGRRVVTSHGYFTPEQIASAEVIDGGIVWGSSL